MNKDNIYCFRLKKAPDMHFKSTETESNPGYSEQMKILLKSYDGRKLYFEGSRFNNYYYSAIINDGYRFNRPKTAPVGFYWAARWLIPVIDDIESII